MNCGLSPGCPAVMRIAQMAYAAAPQVMGGEVSHRNRPARSECRGAWDARSSEVRSAHTRAQAANSRPPHPGRSHRPPGVGPAETAAAKALSTPSRVSSAQRE